MNISIKTHLSSFGLLNLHYICLFPCPKSCLGTVEHPFIYFKQKRPRQPDNMTPIAFETSVSVVPTATLKPFLPLNFKTLTLHTLTQV